MFGFAERRDRFEMIHQAFKNRRRPRIIRYISGNGGRGVYVSEVAERFKISKGSAFVDLSELEAGGVLRHKWETVAARGGTTRLVKSYTLSPQFLAIAQKPIGELLAGCAREARGWRNSPTL